jgi:PTH1 family peptidyl-tRNA hydrolase
MDHFLVTGLGNPGDAYQNTRHNIGFAVLDFIAREQGLKFKEGRLGWVCEWKYKARPVILLKPNTFMNLSGKAVQHWMRNEKINNSHVLIITDDIALPYGKVRMKPKGSDGGHNGLKSIQEHIGSEYPRLRVGIGNDFSKGRQADYVLGEWSETEKKDLDALIKKCADAVLSFIFIGTERTMNHYNG